MAQLPPSKSYARIDVKTELPDLIEVQLESFKRLKGERISDLLHEISPIESYNKDMRLYLPSRTPEAEEWGLTYWFDAPKHTVEECIEQDLTYSLPLYMSVLLAGPTIPEPIKQDIFMGEFPEMTEKGTFIINGTERVVVTQLIRSPGVYYETEVDRSTGQRLTTSKLIPDRGAWMEFDTRKRDYLVLKFNRRRTMPVTIFLRALASVDDGCDDSPLVTGTDEEILSLFEDVDNDPDRLFIPTTLKKEPEWDLSDGISVAEAALLEFFKRMRPGDPATLENAKEFLENRLFQQRRYDFKRVGRYKLNQKLDLHDRVPLDHRTITKWDVVRLLHHMIAINNKMEDPDDIDHLGNRRTKTVDELIQNKLRVGLRRMERIVKERMSIRDKENLSPVSLVNVRPVVAALREFFGSSQLSQFMDQTNPLSELRHKRTLSALGPGGLRRERAGFDVRDVHQSHYGRICPIETPEGPNIGLIGRFACYAKVNDYGFIETPYRRVLRTLPPDSPKMVGRALREDLVDPETDEVIAATGERITDELAEKIAKLKVEEVLVVPFVTAEYEYLYADTEDKFVIAQANSPLNEYSEFVRGRASARQRKFMLAPAESIDYMDVAPHQIVGISAALIPFLEHNDANRALMGSNMQAQGVPLLRPEVPRVSTGMEYSAAVDSGQVVLAEDDGEVVSVTGDRIIVRHDGAEKIYLLRKYQRSNQSTCINQRPAVTKGQIVKKDDVIADSSSTVEGNLGLGQNILVSFMSWEGANYEDAIVVSDRIIQEDYLSSIHIEEHEVEARDTRLGSEEITRDIPNVGEAAIRDLDEGGVIRIGAEVVAGDVLVGKISPKGEKELTPEERLLRAIFGEKSRDVKDTSLRMPHGSRGKVIDVKILSRQDGVELSSGVETMVRVSVAQRRVISPGDKLAGRHGNKGVVSVIVPEQDMPYLEDGTPIDVILNPTGVPGRMNLGQVLETHLGWAARRLGFRAVTPVFDGARETEIEAELARAWIVDRAWKEVAERAWKWLDEDGYDPASIKDDNHVRRLYMEGWLGEQGYDVYDLIVDGTYARRSVAREWLRENGFDPDKVFAFDGTEIPVSERDAQDERAVFACLRLWMKDHGVESSELADVDLREKASEILLEKNKPSPVLGKEILRDGKTGEFFDRPVTVGIMSIIKLHHLVDDKVHARSTGPYSLVSQQPLGGKAQFGGQRFGEMEVWALEAYGAAYILREMLTIKSDDVKGRVKAYEAIVKGEELDEPSLPASFRVLVKELQSIGLSVEATTDAGKVIRFGKEEASRKRPSMSTGLLGLSRRY
ncbi:MAG: DNA-directed RNA polymerase subunit beta [Chloroflexota bacterium]|nr:DNA-directed RNA polymerase subunit beta [Chloroflexota bacterium]